MVGASRESVNKQLRAWQQDGVVRLTRGRVILSDESALEGISNLSSL